MILSFLFFTFIAYLLFRLVFDFVIPIYRTTRKVKRTFREMKERMNAQAGPSQAQTQQSSPDTKKSTLGEYIDFEEVKE